MPTVSLTCGSMEMATTLYMRGWIGYFGFCETPSELTLSGLVDQKAGTKRLLAAVEIQPQVVRGTGETRCEPWGGEEHGWRYARAMAPEHSQGHVDCTVKAELASLGLPSLAARSKS